MNSEVKRRNISGSSNLNKMVEIRRRKADKASRNDPPKASEKGVDHNRSVYKLILILLPLIGAIYLYFHRNIFYQTQSDSLEQSRLPKALIDDIYNQTNWGTMRPHLYFGLKTKHPDSPLFGLVWYQQPREQMIHRLPIRHWCEHGDNVKFSWNAHDGKTFGQQLIVDQQLQLLIEWMAVGQRSWIARLRGEIEGNSSYALAFYLSLQGSSSSSRLIPQNQVLDSSIYHFLDGSMKLGQFSMHIRPRVALTPNTISHAAYLVSPQMDMRYVDQLILASLVRPTNGQLELILHQNEQIQGPQSGIGANFAAVQLTFSGKFDIELNFLSDGDEQPDDFDGIFAQKLMQFDQKFEEIFPIEADNQKHMELAKSALANLLGGIGVWHGHSLVRTGENLNAQQYGPLSLISAVPSRPFFPRGFLWDEGFHNLLIRQFDPQLCLQIFASWMDAMNTAGWIPREMILGEEAQAKVPAEFLVQSPSVANPPMFFYVLEKFVRNPELLKHHYQQIARIYPRLKQFYIWLRTTQQGPHSGTMQWQGRNRTTDRELNPKILPSGLDDFPRATHPSPEEYHLDLFCWMAISSKVLRQLAETFGDSAWVPTVEEDVRLFNDIEHLDKMHWSERRQRYADFGMHSERVQLVQIVKDNKSKRGAYGEGQEQERQFVRKTMEEPKLRLVDDVFGYVNLFPLLLRLLPANNPKLEILLRSLNKTEDLWTPYGLRSLSPLTDSVSSKSPYYLARNTEHDPPYWRGPIWININYLALDALRHYSTAGGPYARLASQIYEQLRANVVQNIAEEYSRTGFLWEHYNDKTGEGMGTKPFTGWTALIVNIIAETY